MSGTQRILVVEDNPAMANVIRFNLAAAGFAVDIARNGQEAWIRLEDDLFDLVITDYQMPVMNGHELIGVMRQSPRYRQTPIILLTAKELELQAVTSCGDLEDVCIRQKPFSPSELVLTCQQLVASPAARGT